MPLRILDKGSGNTTSVIVPSLVSRSTCGWYCAKCAGIGEASAWQRRMSPSTAIRECGAQ
jgi:hypothetical protein